MNEICNGNIKHMNLKKEHIILSNVDCSFNLMDCYCNTIMNILSILYCIVVYFEFRQACVWQKDSVQIELKNKMQQKCKDNKNNRKNRNDKNGVLLFNCIINVFLIIVEYHKCDIFNTNIGKLDENDGSQCLIVKKLNGILIKNAQYIDCIKIFVDRIVVHRQDSTYFTFITRM